MASKDTGCAFVCPPGVAASNPKGLLKIAPSKEKLLNWSLRPPKEPLLAVGSKRVKSDADLEIVGSVVQFFTTYISFSTCSITAKNAVSTD